MFKTIVLCLDGSKTSQEATPLAVELAKRDGAELVLAHVEEKLAAKGGADVHPDEERIQAEIRHQAAQLTDGGVNATVKMATVMPGGPAHALAQIADDVDADLIVIGTHGHSPAVDVFVGGVRRHLLHTAHRPVPAVPSPRHAGSTSAT